MNDKDIFNEVVAAMQKSYPRRHVKIDSTPYGDIIEIDSKHKFNTEGYCLLYNLQRLCKCLEDELI